MRPSSVATCSSPASSSRATSTPCAGCCADWFSLASGGCTGRTRAISAAAPSPPRSPSAASPPPSTTLAGATATNASDAQRACTPSLVTPPGEATPCSSSSKTTRCSAGTTSGSSSSPARRAVGTPCATNTAEPPPNCYLPPPMPWPGAGPRAATGDDASNPSSPTYERSDRSQTSAKPERHGRPAGSRAHFLKLNATGFTEYRAPARLPSADQIRTRGPVVRDQIRSTAKGTPTWTPLPANSSTSAAGSTTASVRRAAGHRPVPRDVPARSRRRALGGRRAPRRPAGHRRPRGTQAVRHPRRDEPAARRRNPTRRSWRGRGWLGRTSSGRVRGEPEAVVLPAADVDEFAGNGVQVEVPVQLPLVGVIGVPTVAALLLGGQEPLARRGVARPLHPGHYSGVVRRYW